MNALTLKARYRNAKLANVPHSRMSPGEQCMEALDLYRAARKARADYPVFPVGDDADAAAVFDEDKEYAAMLFSTARERMRRGFRATASIALLERLADNPMVVAL